MNAWLAGSAATDQFVDRVDAGRRLAEHLRRYRGGDLVVLGLPRGGVPVAFEVARALDAPLDVIVVRKLGLPFQPELAMGAIGEDGARVVNDRIVQLARVTLAEFDAVERRERVELEARVTRLRRGLPRLELAGRPVVIVDDGVATGSTARAACLVARHLGAKKVVMAAPVGAPEAVRDLPEADEVVCVRTPASFTAVGAHYEDFAPVGEDEVTALLDAARRVGVGRTAHSCGADDVDADVAIPLDDAVLAGHLHLPHDPRAVVVFAHGTGSSRHSPRNRYVAQVLQEAGLGTLLMDLLTPLEERDRGNVFDVHRLAERLTEATAWLARRSDTRGCRIGYFGASTGAAAALLAAARPSSRVAAVVSRGGRPDLAGRSLTAVRAPTLLIVGGADDLVLDLNRQAFGALRCPRRLAVVPGATHLFEEPGALTQAAVLARDWFVTNLVEPDGPPAPSSDASEATDGTGRVARGDAPAAPAVPVTRP